MQTQILYQPAYSLAVVTMQAGESIRVESGAMVSMTSGLRMETKATGGIMKSLGRSLLGGESFFQNTYHADGGGEITLAPSLPGDIITFELTGNELAVQSGSFVACDNRINVDTKWGGAKTFFGGEGLFMLKCAGQGTLIVSSYGAIHKVNVPAGQSYVVDTGHIVAFPTGMTYNVRKVAGWKSTILGGEGLVCEFQGPGEIYLQTRSQQAFLSWLLPQIPNRSN
jgi:uncharacterized protein (TIGR00266 family)